MARELKSSMSRFSPLKKKTKPTFPWTCFWLQLLVVEEVRSATTDSCKFGCYWSQDIGTARK